VNAVSDQKSHTSTVDFSVVFHNCVLSPIVTSNTPGTVQSATRWDARYNGAGHPVPSNMPITEPQLCTPNPVESRHRQPRHWRSCV